MSLLEYLESHEEQAFIAKAVGTAVAIILFKEFIFGVMGLLILVFPLAFLIGLRLHAASSGVPASELLKEHITFFPVMRTEEERRLEAKSWVTYGLILINVVIFYGFEIHVSPDFITDYLVFLPHRPDGAFSIVASAFTSIFLHAGSSHLWGNMTFLWVVGTAVERRVGSMKFLRLYLLTGLIGDVVFVLMDWIFHDRGGHILGASGAIAGIMGIFAVRCYFKTMTFPVPILGVFSFFFPLSLKIRLNSLMVMAFFFLTDLSGGLGQIVGTSDSSVGHWAHLGGMISGMLLAGYLNLGEEAVKERHLEIGVKASGLSVDFGKGARSLQIVLDRNPEEIEALLGMARLKTKFTCGEEGKELYEKALRLLVTGDEAQVVEVFREYHGKYLTVPSDPDLVVRLTDALRKAGELPLCIQALQRLVEMPEVPGQVREKALFQLATLLEFTDCSEAARDCFARFLAEYPASILAEKAREKAATPPPDTPAGSAPAGSIAQTCPACGSAMATRTVQRSPNQGRVYHVCSSYPACRTYFPVAEVTEAYEFQTVSLQPLPQSYRLVFDGTLPLSCDKERTKGNLSRLLRCGPEQVDRLLCGGRTVLKRGMDHATALKMKEAFDRTGACCTLEAEEDAAAPLTPLRTPPPAPSPAAPAPPMVQTQFLCPKCGHPQEKGECCIKCGVYFDKLALLVERELQPFYSQSS